jgi:hypothetical protein
MVVVVAAVEVVGVGVAMTHGQTQRLKRRLARTDLILVPVVAVALPHALASFLETTTKGAEVVAVEGVAAAMAVMDPVRR